MKFKLKKVMGIVEAINVWNKMFITDGYRAPYGFENVLPDIDTHYFVKDPLNAINFTKVIFDYVIFLIKKYHLNIDEKNVKILAELVETSKTFDKFYRVDLKISINKGRTYFILSPCTGDDLLKMLKDGAFEEEKEQISVKDMFVFDFLSKLFDIPLDTIINVSKREPIFSSLVIAIISLLINETKEDVSKFITCNFFIDEDNFIRIKIMDNIDQKIKDFDGVTFLEFKNDQNFSSFNIKRYLSYLKMLISSKVEVDDVVNLFTKGLVPLRNVETLNEVIKQYYDYILLNRSNDSKFNYDFGQYVLSLIKGELALSNYNIVCAKIDNDTVVLDNISKSHVEINKKNYKGLYEFLSSLRNDIIYCVSELGNIYSVYYKNADRIKNKIFIAEFMPYINDRVILRQFNKDFVFEKDFIVPVKIKKRVAYDIFRIIED